jgi:hypothetical protein
VKTCVIAIGLENSECSGDIEIAFAADVPGKLYRQILISSLERRIVSQTRKRHANLCLTRKV